MGVIPSALPVARNPDASGHGPALAPEPFPSPTPLKRLGHRLLSAAALVHRRLNRGTRLVAVTGSAGKSTATELLTAVLAAAGPVNPMVLDLHPRLAQARTVLRTRRRHRFTVIEVGTKHPGALRRATLVLEPDVVVVLNVLPMHTNRFPSLDAMAQEKAALLGGLGRRGIAVLNRDDLRVNAMAAGVRAQVQTFGTTPEADVWASGVDATWPGRLRFDLHAGGETRRVTTQLVGEHWAGSVLAALCAGLACGVPLESAIRAVERVRPFTGRLEPRPLPCGAVTLLDTYNGSVTTYRPALRVLAGACGVRRVAVVGDNWDSGLSEVERLERHGREVAAAADVAVFVGPRAEVSRRAAVTAGLPDEMAHACAGVEDAATLLRGELRDGDLMLLKGQWRQHLERIHLAQIGTAPCRRAECDVLIYCENCRHAGLAPVGVGR